MDKTIKWLAIAYLIVGANIYLFWIEFYSGLIFPMDIMREKIKNFDGYYAWETSFTVPDFILATVIIIGAVKLLRNRADKLAHVLLIASSGGLMFLGIVDFTYGLRNGMFSLGHLYSYELLMIGLLLPPFGAFGIYMLHKSLKGMEASNE